MNFKEHSAIREKHAFLSPSTYHWLRYDEQKLAARYFAARQAARGTELHELAHSAIKLGVRIGPSNKTLAAYVKDGIGFRMTVEQPLFYSNNCFGHADTISFRKNVLRISDLKTGVTPTKFDQLEIYAAIFCLEYCVSPFDIKIELRIYQNEEVRLYIPEPQDILDIMDKIVYFDQLVEDLKERDEM
jgi:hypothetical protein